MNQTRLLIASLEKTTDEDTGSAYYECHFSRHYRNGDWIGRWYMPTKSSLKRLKKCGVNLRRQQAYQRFVPSEKWITPEATATE